MEVFGEIWGKSLEEKPSVDLCWGEEGDNWIGEPSQLEGWIAGEKPPCIFFLGVDGSTTLMSPAGDGGVTHRDGCIPTPFILSSKQSRSVKVKLMGFTWMSGSLDI
jgi:hypothetical protein